MTKRQKMAVFIFMKAMIFIVLLCILCVYSEPTLEVEGTAITEGKENTECSCNNSSASTLLQKATDMQVCQVFFSIFSDCSWEDGSALLPNS